MSAESLAPYAITIRVHAIDPPGNCYGADRPILLGVQCRREVEQIGPATATRSFDLDATLSRVGTEHDIKGPYVHGKKGDRFFYLSWGCATADASFEMFARAKLKFCDIDPAIIDELAHSSETIQLRLVCSMAATNEKGHPASGSIRPPRLCWSVEPIE